MEERFYFNANENRYMNETWLIMYLHKTEYIDEDDIIDGLRPGKEYFGWREC